MLLTQNDRLRHLLLKLTRMQFGAKSERLPEEQMQLAQEALEQSIAKGEAEKRDPGLRKDNAARRGQAAVPCRHTCRGSRSHRFLTIPGVRVAGRR